MIGALRALGVLIVLTGLVWIGQGLGYLPGSFMTGQPEWARNGAGAVLLGAGLIYLARRRQGGG